MKIKITEEEFEKCLSKVAQEAFQKYELEESIRKNFKFKFKNGDLAQLGEQRVVCAKATGSSPVIPVRECSPNGRGSRLRPDLF